MCPSRLAFKTLFLSYVIETQLSHIANIINILLPSNSVINYSLNCAVVASTKLPE